MKIIKVLMVLLIIWDLGSASNHSPKAAVKEFYSARMAITQKFGLPDGKDLNSLVPFMSKRLASLIKDANAYQEQLIKKNPSDKPPFCDGDFFSSSEEGVTKFQVGKAKKIENGYRVDLHLVDIDKFNPKEKPIKWTDAVYVIKEDNRFVVDDMEFLGTWPYGHGGSRLSELLQWRAKE
jgi:hypothetical protein